MAIGVKDPRSLTVCVTNLLDSRSFLDTENLVVVPLSRTIHSMQILRPVKGRTRARPYD